MTCHETLTGLVRSNPEAAVVDFVRNDGLRELADNRKLIAEVTIERLKPCGNMNRGIAVPVRGHISAVNVHHLR